MWRCLGCLAPFFCCWLLSVCGGWTKLYPSGSRGHQAERRIKKHDVYWLVWDEAKASEKHMLVRTCSLYVCVCMCVCEHVFFCISLACHIQICSLEPIIFCCGKSRKSFHHPDTCFSPCWPGKSLRLWLPQLPYAHLPQFCKQALYGMCVVLPGRHSSVDRWFGRTHTSRHALLTLHCWRVHRSIWLLGFWHCVY